MESLNKILTAERILFLVVLLIFVVVEAVTS